MIVYTFTIDKDTCFAYWAQSLIQWIWYSKSKDYEHYARTLGPFTMREKNALKRLKKLLQREDAGFLWLWNRYVGNEITDQKELLIWQHIQDTLKDKFEMVWREELPKLEIWRRDLNVYSFQELNAIFVGVAHFFDENTERNRNIIVKLLINDDEKSLHGHVKREFNNCIVLALSSLERRYRDMAISTLAHETIHLIEYASPLSNALFKDSYQRIHRPALRGNLFSSVMKSMMEIFRRLLPSLLLMRGPKLHHLFIEAIITSMAGSSLIIAYVNQKVFHKPSVLPEGALQMVDYRKKDKKNYSTQIKIVASRLVDLTKEYLNNDKKMDKTYSDAVVRAWLDLRGGKNMI